MEISVSKELRLGEIAVCVWGGGGDREGERDKHGGDIGWNPGRHVSKVNLAVVRLKWIACILCALPMFSFNSHGD